MGGRMEEEMDEAQLGSAKAEKAKVEKAKVEKAKVEKAMEELKGFVARLAEQAGESREQGEALWQGISGSSGLLRELAYYYDYGSFLCEYEVAGHTLADVLVWQVDHFKLYMDRPEEMNRFRQPRLLLAAFEAMVGMEKDPEPYLEKMRQETGQDILG